MDTSTLWVVFLLVIAATLASYALSHWSSIRGAQGVGWAATSIGTTMLLTAAAIVVLTFVFKGPLWRPNLGVEPPLRENAAVSSKKETSAGPLAASVIPMGAASTSVPRGSQITRASDRLYAAGSSPASIGNKQQSLQAAPTPWTTELGPEPLRTFKDDEPWAATRCVHIHNPGSDTTQWKIENDCDAPVGVIVSVCAAGTEECARGRPMIFPAKLQRPVALDEQIVHGYSIRHVACFVATSKATYLIGAPSEERSTPEWREQFESARVSDGCLSRLQN